ncbi:hypothetical protein KVT40_008502 [Elsinoe batatas]|uniref:Uncharacterized protein n=1 Tax=Elsinoe batatas TaxID=2601811 RepID=A0A8K0KX11_9PEZI|nr:hypothetical protein KVT40_008502 [Elsinoe batatas]
MTASQTNRQSSIQLPAILQRIPAYHEIALDMSGPQSHISRYRKLFQAALTMNGDPALPMIFSKSHSKRLNELSRTKHRDQVRADLRRMPLTQALARAFKKKLPRGFVSLQTTAKDIANNWTCTIHMSTHHLLSIIDG